MQPIYPKLRKIKELPDLPRRIVLGVDEAGYGPNLGPLVIVVSEWEIPADLTEQGLIDALSVDFKPQRLNPDSTHIPLGDSKLLYSSTAGIDSLEASVLALLQSSGLLKQVPIGLQTFLEALGDKGNSVAPSTDESLPPWYHFTRDALPTRTELQIPGDTSQLELLNALSKRAFAALQKCDVRFLGARAKVVREPEFNARLKTLGSKGLLLSQETLRLVRDSIKCYAGRGVEAYCDRQGGRKNYLPVLQDTWPESWFQPLLQESQRSSYFDEQMDFKVHFTVKGDRFPPTAFASMIAKYLRERSMDAFNDFWRRHLPDVKPTAGYPVDALRFRNDIARKAAALQLDPACWWRNK